MANPDKSSFITEKFGVIRISDVERTQLSKEERYYFKKMKQFKCNDEKFQRTEELLLERMRSSKNTFFQVDAIEDEVTEKEIVVDRPQLSSPEKPIESVSQSPGTNERLEPPEVGEPAVVRPEQSQRSHRRPCPTSEAPPCGTAKDIGSGKDMEGPMKSKVSVDDSKQRLAADSQANADKPINKKETVGTRFNRQLERSSLSEKDAKRDRADFLALRDVKNCQQWANTTTVNELCDYLIRTRIHFQDGILALNKPCGIPTIGGPHIRLAISSALPPLAERLRSVKGTMFLHLIHRLDKDTSGVLLCAYDPEVEKRMRQCFEDKTVLKQYLVITKGVPSPSEGEIVIPIEEQRMPNHKFKILPSRATEPAAKKAVTRYSVLAERDGMALVAAQPLTGIKHQLRCHFAFGLQCPLLGDHKYSHFQELKPQRLDPMILKKLDLRQSKVRDLPLYMHAQSCILRNFLPAPRRHLTIQAPIPQHFLRMMKLLHLKLP